MAQNLACHQPSDAITNSLDPEGWADIPLAQELNADLLLLDDVKVSRTATERGLVIKGILGILDRATTMKVIDLPADVQKLQSTFRIGKCFSPLDSFPQPS